MLLENERWLRTILFARLNNADEVREVLQEVALAAVRSQSPPEDPEKYPPWLYRLAVRQALLYRRKRGRSRNLTQRFGELKQPSESDSRDPDPLEWLLADERRQRVREAMSRLRQRDAEMLMLKYVENWSYRQIAAQLGVSESAVEARLHRARGRLREELATLEITETNL
ncbi:RNA polymerase sigma factor SigV [Lignipirellula cremea]|uniref:RNA polymerase sigma factor SigV n=1 Tax=Lignipirellula cremea TaxID=2528010 RepID=A0A518DP00_9BACT|nr:RNA polymerase sigma factor SigV [Lignipirellula cremea]